MLANGENIFNRWFNFKALTPTPRHIHAKTGKILKNVDRGESAKDTLLYEMQRTHIALFNLICFADKSGSLLFANYTFRIKSRTTTGIGAARQIGYNFNLSFMAEY